MFERYRTIILGAVAIALVGGVVAVLTYRPAPVAITILPPPPTDMPAPTVTPAPLKVYVTGAVVNADGVYELPPGSRVQDAILAAGGPLPDADLSTINMAKPLVDGDEVKVLTIKLDANATDTKPTKPAAIATSVPASVGAPVHINSGDLNELERLPRVGPVMGQAIIDYRAKHGPFKSINDLDQVSGIGPATLKIWLGLIAFD